MASASIVPVNPTIVYQTMVKLEPSTPWQNTYNETANAIAEASNADPLYTDEMGSYRTAALLIAIARHESTFKASAIHPKSGAMGLFQIQPPTARLAPGREHFKGNLLLQPRSAAPIAIDLIRTSDRICAKFPVDDRLIWYAQGGPDCEPVRFPESLKFSRHVFWNARQIDKYFRELLAPMTPIPSTISNARELPVTGEATGLVPPKAG